MARHRRVRRRPAWSRGWVARGTSVLIGSSVAASMIAGLVLAVPASTPRVTPDPSIRTGRPLSHDVADVNLAWPAHGGAAVVVENAPWSTSALSLAAPRQNASAADIVPIASLTKMMTALVTLQALPLGRGERGPCLTISAHDVAHWRYDTETDQSNVKVAEGERLCEADLLTGLLIGSANNFADLLATMVSGSTDAFVAEMNREAALIAPHTTYVEPSGYEPGNVSTPLDQISVAQHLMAFPFAREVVARPRVTLPVAGVVESYTPFVGSHGVIGVKSGRTGPAGGCVVLAMRRSIRGHDVVVYSAVFSQFGGDVLAHAGAAGLALGTDALAHLEFRQLKVGQRVGSVTWGSQRVGLVVIRARPILSWRGDVLRLRFRVTARAHQQWRARTTIARVTINDVPYGELGVSSNVGTPSFWKAIW